MRIWLLAALAIASLGTPLHAQDDAVKKVIVPFVTKHCVSCHGPEKKKADLELHVFKDEASILKARKTWMNVLTQLHVGEMPPSGRPKPAAVEGEQFAKAVKSIFDSHDRNAKPDPGRVTMRRLNRAEYVNTIRDLVGVDIPIGDDFPGDDVGHGFDNIGDVLTISPLHMERYMAAAETIMRAAIITNGAPKPVVRTVAGRFMEPAIIPVDRPRPLYTKGPLHTTFKLQQKGECQLVVRMSAELAGKDPVKVAVLLDGKTIKEYDIKEKSGPGQAKKYVIPLTLKAGEHKVGISILNEYTDPKDEKIRRGVRVEFVQLIGPMNALPISHQELLATPEKSDHDAATRIVLERFASRAYRRPATKDEVERLVKIVKQAEDRKESWEAAVSLAMQAALVSPKFLFRVELDSRPDSKDMHPIDDYQLASRLSYFLWSTMPDEELLKLAAEKKLHANLAQQTKRMLKDPRSKALTENFAMQWLQLRLLKNVAPDPKLFPEFNDKLRGDMQKETELFFGAVVDEDRSILDLIDGKFTFLNDRLAKLYGIRDTNGNPYFDKAINPKGSPIPQEKFVRVSLENTKRGGLLTQASVLTVTSNPTRTSPVKRGRWVLEQILGTPPPPPPPNVPELDNKAQTKGTLRQRMEQHRSNAACAGCHARMDPIGFGFENFNAIGKFRAKDGNSAIDPAGELPGGQKFQGPEELRAILAGKKELFSRCLAEKMVTYAVGRGIEHYDQPAIDGILAVLSTNEYRFSSLVLAVVQSDPFRMRRGKDQK